MGHRWQTPPTPGCLRLGLACPKPTQVPQDAGPFPGPSPSPAAQGGTQCRIHPYPLTPLLHPLPLLPSLFADLSMPFAFSLLLFMLQSHFFSFSFSAFVLHLLSLFILVSFALSFTCSLVLPLILFYFIFNCLWLAFCYSPQPVLPDMVSLFTAPSLFFRKEVLIHVNATHWMSLRALLGLSPFSITFVCACPLSSLLPLSPSLPDLLPIQLCEHLNCATSADAEPLVWHFILGVSALTIPLKNETHLPQTENSLSPTRDNKYWWLEAWLALWCLMTTGISYRTYII